MNNIIDLDKVKEEVAGLAGETRNVTAQINVYKYSHNADPRIDYYIIDGGVGCGIGATIQEAITKYKAMAADTSSIRAKILMLETEAASLRAVLKTAEAAQ